MSHAIFFAPSSPAFSFSKGARSGKIVDHYKAPWVEDREAYIAEKAADLIACIIQPISATVVEASHPEYSFAEYQKSKVWAIAKSGDNWLLTLDGKPEFALDFGSDPASIVMLGFSSTDALEEWLG